MVLGDNFDAVSRKAELQPDLTEIAFGLKIAAAHLEGVKAAFNARSLQIVAGERVFGWRNDMTLRRQGIEIRDTAAAPLPQRTNPWIDLGAHTEIDVTRVYYAGPSKRHFQDVLQTPAEISKALHDGQDDLHAPLGQGRYHERVKGCLASFTSAAELELKDYALACARARSEPVSSHLNPAKRVMAIIAWAVSGFRHAQAQPPSAVRFH